MDHDDLDEDIQRLNVVLQDEEDEEEGDSEGELRVLENDGIILHYTVHFVVKHC